MRSRNLLKVFSWTALLIGYTCILLVMNTLAVIETVAPITQQEAMTMLLEYGEYVDPESIRISRNPTRYSGRVHGSVWDGDEWLRIDITVSHTAMAHPK